MVHIGLVPYVGVIASIEFVLCTGLQFDIFVGFCLFLELSLVVYVTLTTSVASASNSTTSDRDCESTLESLSHALKCFVTEKWR